MKKQIDINISIGIGLSYTWNRVFINDIHSHNVYNIILGIFNIEIKKFI